MKRYSAGFMGLLGCLVLAVLMFPTAISHLAMGSSGMMFFPIAGMIVNKAALNAVFLNLKTTFNMAFDTAPSVWEKIAMLVPSGSSENQYNWLAYFPKMRKWVGEKAIKSLEAFKYTIKNDDWEATVEVDRNDIEDDNLGIYAPQAQMAGWSAKQLPDEIVMELVNKGFENKCYDEQYFFDTDHPVGDGAGGVSSISNKGVAVLSMATLAAAQASLGAARIAMMKFKNNEGQPLNIMPSVLLVPPALLDVATVLCNNGRLEDGKQNPYKGCCTVVCDTRLTSDTAWYLLDATKPVKPFVYQQRKAPVFVEQTDPQTEDVFNKRKFKFGAEARAAGGYGFWQLAYGSTGLGA